MSIQTAYENWRKSVEANRGKTTRQIADTIDFLMQLRGEFEVDGEIRNRLDSMYKEAEDFLMNRNSPQPTATQEQEEPWHEAAYNVVYYAERAFEDTHSSPIEIASYMVDLSNALSDLKTFLPGYDWEHGTIPWDREE